MNKADLIAKLAPKLNINQDEARVVFNSGYKLIRIFCCEKSDNPTVLFQS